ncbi:MAG TPA: hypothetical protein VJ754_05700, partial [Anaerolineae bacterium]|nr:hypothetical protein [Anaerolineae bacterium]
MRIRVCVVMLAMALAACGGSGQASPEATAPPQPTPVEPATPTEAPPLIAPTPLPASPTPELVAGGRLSFTDAGIVLGRINLPPAPDGKVYV